MARRKRGIAFGCNELVISVNRLLSEIYWSTKILFEVVRCGEEVMVASIAITILKELAIVCYNT